MPDDEHDYIAAIQATLTPDTIIKIANDDMPECFTHPTRAAFVALARRSLEPDHLFTILARGIIAHVATHHDAGIANEDARMADLQMHVEHLMRILEDHICLETYRIALAQAGWSRDDFERYMVLVDASNDGIANDDALDAKMAHTQVDDWALLLDLYPDVRDIYERRANGMTI